MKGRRWVVSWGWRMAAASLLVVIAGCSTLLETGPGSVPPLRTFEAVVHDPGPYVLVVNDPLEGVNRGLYVFNDYFDTFFYRPVVRVYERVLPVFVQDRISRGLDNMGEFTNFTNNLLQTKFADAGVTVLRFVLNSSLGIGGLWDPATMWGLPRKPADFGQTLGHYGLGSGPYLMLPILGPSDLRDATGQAADQAAFTLIGPIAWINNTAASSTYAGLSALDERHRIPFRYHQTGSPFEYDLLRMLYTLTREYDVTH